MGNPPPPPPAPPPRAQTDWTLVTWRCEYCKRPNWRTGLGCEGCGAPMPSTSAQRRTPPPFRPDLDLIETRGGSSEGSLLENIGSTVVGLLTVGTVLGVIVYALFYAP